MPIHTVKQGEHLSRITAEHGFVDFRTIWNHPENAELKQQRQNPNVLFPGDDIFIPDLDLKEESGASDKRHRFKLRRQQLKLHLRILDFNNQPFVNRKCELRVEGDVHQLTTDNDGRLEGTISQTAEGAVLIFKDALAPFDLDTNIKIGHLDPVEKVSGQIARLNNLGYLAGPLDSRPQNTEEENQLDQQFRSAVEEFQCDHSLLVDGKCGPRTQAKLKEVHGC